MLNRTNLILLLTLTAAFTLSAFGREISPAGRSFPSARAAATFQNPSDRAQDGLFGPVRRVKTETAKITTKNGKPVEGPRVILETATYDIKGAKIDNAYFLAAGGTLTGKEVYKYDDKGNIAEMTLHNEDGSLLSKETYAYEFDAFGNWTKMVASVAVMEGSMLSFEATEVTYRTFFYFVDEASLARMSQPTAPATASANASVPAAAPLTPAAQPAADNKPSVPAAAQPRSVAAPANSATVLKADHKVVNGASKMADAPLPAATADKSGIAVPSAVASVGTGSSSAGPVVNAEGEAPDRRVARGPVKPISGGILNGKAIKLPAPSYPDLARRARAAGVVAVEVVIDVTGRVISAKAVGGHPMLQQAAEKAAMQARFSPTLLSGQPVRVSGQITYNFTLN